MDDRKPIRLLIAEPLPLVREALAALCRERKDLLVIGTCSDGATALRIIQNEAPDVALLELDLPVLHALELLGQARDYGSPTRIVMMTTRNDRKTVIEALRSGAQGYVLKSAAAKQLYDAVSQVHTGGIFISPQVEVEKIFAATRGRKEPEDPFETLSAREHQVFTMLVDGLRAKEIAARLDVSPKTIDTYRASMMRKLDIHDVAGLVKFAIHRNLTKMPAVRYKTAGEMTGD